MTDQTRWGIDLVQQANKAKVHEEQKEMREEVKDFVFNCSVFNLQKMYQEMNSLVGWSPVFCDHFDGLYALQQQLMIG